MTETTFPGHRAPPRVVLLPSRIGNLPDAAAALARQFASRGWDVGVYYNAASATERSHAEAICETVMALRQQACAWPLVTDAGDAEGADGGAGSDRADRASGGREGPGAIQACADAVLAACERELGLPDCLVTAPGVEPGVHPIRAMTANAAPLPTPDMRATMIDVAQLGESVNRNVAWPLALSLAMFVAGPHTSRESFGEGGETTSRVAIHIVDSTGSDVTPDHLPFAMSQTGMHMATPVLARAYAPWMRVVGVATPLLDGSKVGDVGEVREIGSDVVALARAVQFLADAVTITGSILWVDGGKRYAAPQAFSV